MIQIGEQEVSVALEYRGSCKKTDIRYSLFSAKY